MILSAIIFKKTKCVRVLLWRGPTSKNERTYLTYIQLYTINFSIPNQFYKNFDFWTESYLKVKNILNMKIMRKPRLRTVYGVMVTENLLKTDKGVFVTIYGYSGEVVRNWSWWLLKPVAHTHRLLRIYQNLPQSP